MTVGQWSAKIKFEILGFLTISMKFTIHRVSPSLESEILDFGWIEDLTTGIVGHSNIAQNVPPAVSFQTRFNLKPFQLKLYLKNRILLLRIQAKARFSHF
jgi:hypothetical protein